MTATETDVLAGVTEIVREENGLPPGRSLPPGTHLRNDLGADSLIEAAVAMEVEDRFGVDVPDDAHPETIQEIVDTILALRKRQ